MLQRLRFQPPMWTLNIRPDAKVSLLETFVVTDVLMTNSCEHSHSFTLTYFFTVTLTFGTGVLHLIQINHQPAATIF
jgi:hypothetical protein